MAGASCVVADGLRRAIAEEDAPCVLDQSAQAPGVLRKDAEVFRGVLTGEAYGFLDALRDHEPPTILEGCARDVATGKAFKALYDLRDDTLGEVERVRDEDGGGELVVFSLGDEVDGADGGVGV